MSENILPAPLQHTYRGLAHRMKVTPPIPSPQDVADLGRKIHQRYRILTIVAGVLLTVVGGAISTVVNAEPFSGMFVGASVAFMLGVLGKSVVCLESRAIRSAHRFQKRKIRDVSAVEDGMVAWWCSVREAVLDAGFDGLRILESREGGRWSVRAVLYGHGHDGVQVVPFAKDGAVWLITEEGAPVLRPYGTGSTQTVVDDFGNQVRLPRVTVETIIG